MKTFFITLSSSLGACAFLFPPWCAEFVFIFLVVLFYAVIKSNFSVSYKDGLWWGFVFYAIFFLDLFRLILNRGYGLSRFFAILFLLTYCLICVALWFGLAQKTSTAFNNSLFKLMSWAVVTWLYFYWVDSAFFWVFGNWEGNQLNHPVVPLAIRPLWLYVLPFFGKNGFLFILVFFSLSVVVLLTDFSKKKAFVFFCSCSILLAGWIVPKHKKNIPEWVKNIGCIIADTDDKNPFSAAEHIMFSLDEFQKIHPDVTCIIMPESSFKFPLNLWAQCLRLWKTENRSTLLIGGHRKEGDCLFNTLYQIEQGTIVNYYDKKHRLFFTERIPGVWAYLPGSRTLFLKDHLPFDQSTNKCTTLCVDYLEKLCPLICSDLFFIKRDEPDNYSFLCIVNDSWFISAYIPRLMYLHAKVIALVKQRSMLYVSYKQCMFIDKDGNEQFLPTLIG